VRSNAVLSRRRMLTLLSASAVAGALAPLGRVSAATTPRCRVIIDNDFSGDPDGLFQLAHHALSPAAEIPLIIGSHLHVGDFWDPSERQAANGAEKARELLGVLGAAEKHRVVAGSNVAIKGTTDWVPSAATAEIVGLAAQSEPELPLFYAAGAGLTELALAWLAEPSIGSRLRLIWIGGEEHSELAYPPPGKREGEYNRTIDPIAAQIIFNESNIEIWQVPRDAYRQMLFSLAELEELAAASELGAYLKRQLDRLDIGETYVLGDSPLVTLTALQSPFQADASSSRYHLMSTPNLTPEGRYEVNPTGRPMRVYTAIDTRLTFSDMVRKFRMTASN
jgi:hypothetical protein